MLLEFGLMDIVMKIYKTEDPISRASATGLLSMFITCLCDFSYCGEILNTASLLNELVKEVLSSDHNLRKILGRSTMYLDLGGV
jgi:hypothetical protein